MTDKKTKEFMQEFAIKKALGYSEKDPEKNAPKLLDMLDTIVRMISMYLPEK